jgi:hypothetical protein
MLKELTKLTVVKLKRELVHFGLETTGKKAHLIERLAAYLEAEKDQSSGLEQAHEKLPCSICCSGVREISALALVYNLKVFLAKGEERIPLVLIIASESESNVNVCTSCYTINRVTFEKKKQELLQAEISMQTEPVASKAHQETQTESECFSDPDRTAPLQMMENILESEMDESVLLMISESPTKENDQTAPLQMMEKIDSAMATNNLESEKKPKRPYPNFRHSLVANAIRNSPVRPFTKPMTPSLKRSFEGISCAESPVNPRKIRALLVDEMLDEIISNCPPGSPKEYKRTHFPSMSLKR